MQYTHTLVSSVWCASVCVCVMFARVTIKETNKKKQKPTLISAKVMHFVRNILWPFLSKTKNR